MKRSGLPLLLLLVSALVSLAAPPAWWSAPETKILDTNIPATTEDNYAPANLGQLKNVAKQAKIHLDNYLPDGAGTDINNLVGDFEPKAGVTYTTEQLAALLDANYAPINLGQLKRVAKPFYDQLLLYSYGTKANLIAHGYPSTWASNYPWSTPPPKVGEPGYNEAVYSAWMNENYAPANIGQLKVVFSFDLEGFEPLPIGWAAWVTANFPNTSNLDPHGDADGDGISNLDEFLQGTDPNDFFNGQPPVLSIVSGNNQGDLAGHTLAHPYEVKLTNSNGHEKVGAAIAFAIQSGGGQLNIANGGTTDVAGIARATLTLPNTITTVTTIASFGSVQVTFTATVGDPDKPPESVEGEFDAPTITQEHGETTAIVTWQDGFNNENGFRIERSSNGRDWQVVTTVSANVTSFTDTGLVPDEIHFYRIIAFNSAP